MKNSSVLDGMYYIQHGDVVIVMLGGGDKSTQQQDIDRESNYRKHWKIKSLKSLIYQVLIWLQSLKTEDIVMYLNIVLKIMIQLN